MKRLILSLNFLLNNLFLKKLCAIITLQLKVNFKSRAFLIFLEKNREKLKREKSNKKLLDLIMNLGLKLNLFLILIKLDFI